MRKSCILIHGAWHGSWAWKYVAAPIKDLGYTKVLTPNLPGHGDNTIKDFKDITLHKYVSHVTNLVHSLSDPVVLIGHSMAGIVMSQVAENIPNKIAYLIYISGFIPDSKGSLVDEEQRAKFPSVAPEVTISKEHSSISVNPSKIKELFYNMCNNEDFLYATAHFQGQPLQPFLDKVSVSKERFDRVPKFYIKCLQDRAIHIVDQQRMHSKVVCNVKSLDSDHSPFFSSKEDLVKLIGIIDNEYEAGDFNH